MTAQLEREPTYTTDPSMVTEVTWYVASDSVLTDEEYESEQYPESAERRMQLVLATLFDKVKLEYPNATDVYIANGGHENQYANSASRCETSDDSIYEPFYDDMTRLEDAAIAKAFQLIP